MHVVSRNILAGLVLVALCGSPAAGETGVELSLVHTGLAHDSLYDLAFDGARGIAVGDHGLAIESRDGGRTWTDLRLPGESAVLAVALEGETALMVGQGGVAFRREGDTDAVAVDTGSGERLMSVSLAGDLALVVGGFGTVLVSRDAGVTFQPLVIDWSAVNEDGFEPHLYDVAITAEGDWLICGEFGLVLRSDDEGLSWETVNAGEASLFALHLRADGVGFSVGQDGVVIRTTDMGRTWQRLAVRSSANLLGVWSAPGGEVVVVGIRELLHSRDDGATFARARSRQMERGWYQGISDGLTVTGEGGREHASRILAVGQFGQVIEIVDP